VLRGADPNPATQALLVECNEAVNDAGGAAAVWAIEAQSPEVSAAKLTGLVAHYGIDATSGGEYFALHQDLDRAHEAELRRVMLAADPRSTIATAEGVSSRLWDLLSSVERAA
jgi:pyrroloquinoline quinone (PQQ) biosynthesis protein C